MAPRCFLDTLLYSCSSCRSCGVGVGDPPPPTWSRCSGCRGRNWGPGRPPGRRTGRETGIRADPPPAGVTGRETDCRARVPGGHHAWAGRKVYIHHPG
eukprot:gene20936-biopygen22150